MITNILIILWTLFIIAVSAVMIRNKNHAPTLFEFQNFVETGITYVVIDIQGNLLNMVVDSGCAGSMLVKSAIDSCEFMYKKTDDVANFSTITSEKTQAKAINIDFNIGKKKVNENFYVVDTDDFVSFNELFGITIHGLLGASFLEANGCTIDYENHKLIVPYDISGNKTPGIVS